VTVRLRYHSSGSLENFPKILSLLIVPALLTTSAVNAYWFAKREPVTLVQYVPAVEAISISPVLPLPVSVTPSISSQLTAVQLARWVEEAAARSKVPPGLLMSIIFHESRFETRVVSPKGARGLMQLMPSVMEQYGVSDAFNPKVNIDTGARLFGRLLDLYRGDVKLALAAYNAGPGRVDEYHGVPRIKETQFFVAAIASENMPLATSR
jgi:soluble lytic murein transglycosylase-like protein